MRMNRYANECKDDNKINTSLVDVDILINVRVLIVELIFFSTPTKGFLLGITQTTPLNEILAK